MRRHVLIDTNVLITAVDPREQDKADLAAAVVADVTGVGRAAVTPQIIAEYFNATTKPKRGLSAVFSAAEAAASIVEILAVCACVELTSATINEAVRGAMRYQLNIYDAHIWAAARTHGIGIVLTEDLQSQLVIEGVRYVNPFAGDFALADIGL